MKKFLLTTFLTLCILFALVFWGPYILTIALVPLILTKSK